MVRQELIVAARELWANCLLGGNDIRRACGRCGILARLGRRRALRLRSKEAAKEAKLEICAHQ